MPALKKSVKRAAAANTLPTKIGTPYGGGFYVGRFFDGGKAYALIVAPKADGEKESIKWNDATTKVKDAQSYSNGAANTAAMAKAGSAVAKWARGLTIGSHKDWYLPSRVESLVLFGERRALKAFDEGKPDGFALAWYWTSSQHADADAYVWSQSFGDGLQGCYPKGLELRARAVRRIAI